MNNELKRLRGEEPGPPDDSKTRLQLSIDSVIKRTVLIKNLSFDDALCVFCQENLCREDPESPPLEDPIRLNCGHIVGRRCLVQWLSTLTEGVFQVPQTFNSTCPSCRKELYSLGSIEELGTDNRRRWRRITQNFREFITVWVSKESCETCSDNMTVKEYERTYDRPKSTSAAEAAMLSVEVTCGSWDSLLCR
jgi:hypothetical protein